MLMVMTVNKRTPRIDFASFFGMKKNSTILGHRRGSSLVVTNMDIRKIVVWGEQTIFWTGQKTSSQLSFQIYNFVLKISEMLGSRPGKCLVLHIGVDSHAN